VNTPIFKAAIFDLDGLMIDSEPLWDSAKKEVFSTVGISLSPEMCAETMGLRQADMVRYWYEKRPWPGASLAAVEAQIVDLMSKSIARNLRPLPGVLTLLGELAAKGLRLAVASSSPFRVIEAAVSALGVRSLFDALCSAEDEVNGKPSPDVYLTAARALGVSPAQTLAFEDSPTGIRAALAAGLYVIAVPSLENSAAPAVREAHLVLSSLDQFKFDETGSTAFIQTHSKAHDGW